MKNDTTLQLASEDAPCTLELVTDGTQPDTAPKDDKSSCEHFAIMPSFRPTYKDQTRYLKAIQDSKSFMKKFGAGRESHTHYNYYANRVPSPNGTQRMVKEWVSIEDLEQIGLSRNTIGPRLTKAVKAKVIVRKREGKHFIYKYSDVLFLLSDNERKNIGL